MSSQSDDSKSDASWTDAESVEENTRCSLSTSVAQEHAAHLDSPREAVEDRSDEMEQADPIDYFLLSESKIRGLIADWREATKLLTDLQIKCAVDVANKRAARVEMNEVREQWRSTMEQQQEHIRHIKRQMLDWINVWLMSLPQGAQVCDTKSWSVVRVKMSSDASLLPAILDASHSLQLVPGGITVEDKQGRQFWCAVPRGFHEKITYQSVSIIPLCLMDSAPLIFPSEQAVGLGGRSDALPPSLTFVV